MSARCVTALGGYLPMLRLQRKAAASALASTGLSLPKAGHRAVAGWDEDALTMAVEAARQASSEQRIDELIFASTSAHFTDRLQAGILLDALHLPRETLTEDVANSRRCAVTALCRALSGSANTLICTGEKRTTIAGSVQHLAYGDGAAACLVTDKSGARCISAASLSHDLVDAYTSCDHPAPYAYEPRFVRDTAVKSIFAPTILRACERAGISPKNIAHAIIPEPTNGVFKALARELQMSATDVAGDVSRQVGDLGAAHPLYALGVAFDRAKKGDIVLLTAFGSGCDALLFELESPVPGADVVAQNLDLGKSFSDYVRFLHLQGSLDIDWGMRSEFTQKAQASVIERYGREILGFIGGRDSAGNVQFPKTRIPVNPELSGPEALEDIRLADEIGTVVSCTADRLSYCPDPPFTYGLVQFDNGARVMMEFTDTNGRTTDVGDRVCMRLRIKTEDKARGFRTYFWKAAPQSRQKLEIS